MNSIPIIIDTDIGTDIDDAYALALALKADEIKISGISTVSGNTINRARIVKKICRCAKKQGIPIFAGKSSRFVPMTYGKWAKDESLDQISTGTECLIDFYWKYIEEKSSESLHIVALGPLSNIALIRDIDPEKFDENVKILMMGGSFNVGYFGIKFPCPEYNIVKDIRSAKSIFESSVSISIVPLDVTAKLKLEKQYYEPLLDIREKDELVDALITQTEMFKSNVFGGRLPILFDAATVATLLDDGICEFREMPIKVTRFGYTWVTKQPKSGSIKHRSIYLRRVCMKLNAEAFFSLLLAVLTHNLTQQI
ncbi:MAG: nucleoside hydrolase [Promethearchaeota archaeon]